jgi:putative addiction module component (TIGR02574 family)
MTSHVQQVTAEALALSDDDRSVLIERLVDSLQEADGLDEAYRRELALRAEAVRRGTARLRDWSEVERYVAGLKESRT